MWEEQVSADGTKNYYCAYDSALVQVAWFAAPAPCFALRVRHREHEVHREVKGYDSAGLLGAALRSMGLPLPAALRDHYATKGYREEVLDDMISSRPLAAELMGAVAAYRDITGSEKICDAWLTRSERQRLRSYIGARIELWDAPHTEFFLWREAHSPVAQYAR